MSLPFDSFGDGGGGTLRNIRLESLVTEELINTYSDTDGSISGQEHGGQTGLVITLGGETLNILTGEAVLLLYTLLKSVVQIGVGADGRLYVGRGRIVIDENGIIGYDSGGVAQFSLDATTGAGIFAGGNATIAADAIRVLGLLYTYTHVAESGGETRTLRLGMGLKDGSTTPAGELVFTGDAGSDIIVNGDFELGALTNWAKLVETNGLWGISTSTIYEGVYSAVFTPSAAANSGELGSDRMAVTAGDSYELAGQIYITAGSTAWGDLGAYVEYYDHPTAGSLVDSASMTMPFVPGAWQPFVVPSIVPSGAVSARIRFDVGGNATVPLYLDDITFTEVGVHTALRFLPDPSFIGRVQFRENYSAADSDDAYLALTNRYHTPLIFTDGYGVDHLGTLNYRRTFVSNTTTTTVVGTWTLPAHSTGDNGHVDIEIWFRIFNNSGASRSFTAGVILNATVIITRAVTIPVHATQFYTARLTVRISNSGGPTAQRAAGVFQVGGPDADLGTGTWNILDHRWANSAAEDTQTDLGLAVVTTFDFASANLWVNTLGINGHGPVELG